MDDLNNATEMRHSGRPPLSLPVIVYACVCVLVRGYHSNLLPERISSLKGADERRRFGRGHVNMSTPGSLVGRRGRRRRMKRGRRRQKVKGQRRGSVREERRKDLRRGGEGQKEVK